MEVLEAMQFPVKMQRWIFECVTTVQYSVSMNGYLEGIFKGGRGLRQGDPISPYLFLLIMEAFSCLLNRRAQRVNFVYHPKCVELQITHVCFADDLFIPAGADCAAISIVKGPLEDFSNMSGLFPRAQKRSISICDTEEVVVQRYVIF